MANIMGQIIIVCLMVVISTSSSPLGESNNNAEQVSPIKKAYTYVSEYKRLPVFNFGIGKRWTNANGVKGAQPYSFGFGKRSAPADVYPLRMGLNGKRTGRIRLYDFGLGKRMIPNFGSASFNTENSEDAQALRSFLNEEPEHRFVYGSSNRLVEDQDEMQEGD